MKTTIHAGRNSIWFGIARLAFIVFLAAIFFLLGQSMVQHRFHTGGRRHWDGSVGQ